MTLIRKNVEDKERKKESLKVVKDR